MKTSTKQALIFISTFLGVVAINYIIFVGIFSQISTEIGAWFLNSFVLSIFLLFLFFLGIPSLVSYYVTFRFYKAKKIEQGEEDVMNKKNQIIFALVTTVILGILLFVTLNKVLEPKFEPYTFHEIQPGGISELLVTPSPSVTPGEAVPTPTFPGKTYTPTPVPTGKLTPTDTPTPTPTRVPNPPIINISYPSEMQSIEMDSTQTLCVVDVTAGGDTSGLQRRHNINNGGWVSYTSHFTLCFDPKEDLNRISLQYKNSYGDESVVYTRQFNFHRLQDITITISGQIYRDENCNGVRDTGESNIGVSTIVRMWKMPEFSLYAEFNSNSDGTFSYSTKISENDSINLQPSVQSPSGYKSNPNFTPPTFTLNSNNRSASLDYPQVPAEFVSQCTF